MITLHRNKIEVVLLDHFNALGTEKACLPRLEYLGSVPILQALEDYYYL